MNQREMIRRGYRRTSSKYGIVSRIDREDWVMVLAKALRRAPADFYVPGGSTPAANWCDHYRRVYSKDKIELGHYGARNFPSSCHNGVGFVEPPKSVIESTPQPGTGKWFEGIMKFGHTGGIVKGPGKSLWPNEMPVRLSPSSATGRFREPPEPHRLPGGRTIHFIKPQQSGKSHALAMMDYAKVERRIFAQMAGIPGAKFDGMDGFDMTESGPKAGELIDKIMKVWLSSYVDMLIGGLQTQIDEEGCGAAMAAVKSWKD